MTQYDIDLLIARIINGGNGTYVAPYFPDLSSFTYTSGNYSSTKSPTYGSYISSQAWGGANGVILTYDPGTNVSRQDFTGGAGGDVIYTGNCDYNNASGSAGNDTIIGGGGNLNAYGGDDNDVIIGGLRINIESSGNFLASWKSVLMNAETMSQSLLHGYISYYNFDNTIYGGRGNDLLITPGDGNNSLYGDGSSGAAGNDTIIAGSGNNFADGGDGNDVIVLGNGNNSVYGGLGSDTIVAGSGNNTIQAGSGNDYIEVAENNSTISAGDDSIAVISNHGFIDGGDGFDVISFENFNAGVNVDTSLWTNVFNVEGLVGSKYDDTLVAANNVKGNLMGGAGNDVLRSGNAADVLNGGEGMDIVDYSASNTAININLTANTASGGFAQGDVLTSIEGIIGSGSNDTIVAGPNAGYFDGRLGTDMLSYAQSTAGVQVEILANASGAPSIGRDTVISIENLLGSKYSDTLIGSSANETFDGGQGADVIDGRGGTDTVTYVSSTAAVNVSLSSGEGLGGTAEGDRLSNVEVLIGSNYNDTLSAADTGSQLLGGTGNDLYISGAGSDYFYNVNGTDTVDYSRSTAGVSVNLYTGRGSGGFAEGDTLTGISAVIGSSYDDTLSANYNTLNNLVGGAGNDILKSGSYADTLNGGAGMDIVDYSGSNKGISVNLTTNTASGGFAQGDVLTSIEGIIGSGSNDTIIGSEGNNIIVGLSGQNTLTGKGGADMFTYGVASNVSGANDTITDFNRAEGDKIVFYAASGSGEVATRVVNSLPPAAVTGFFGNADAVIVNLGNNSYVYADANHDGNLTNADFKVTVSNTVDLTGVDITFTNIHYA